MSYKCKEDVRPQKGRQSELFKMIANQEADFYLVGGSRFGGEAFAHPTLNGESL